MKRAIGSIVCAMLLCASVQAFADETMPKEPAKPGMSEDAMMKDCMKEQAAMNSGMSQSEMKKACEDKMMKMKKEHDDMNKPK